MHAALEKEEKKTQNMLVYNSYTVTLKNISKNHKTGKIFINILMYIYLNNNKIKKILAL